MTDDRAEQSDDKLSSDTNEMASYLGVFIEETEEELDAAASALIELEQNVDNPALIDEVFRLVHSMKGSSGMMGLATISNLAHRWEDLLDRLRSNDNALQRQHVDVMLRCVDTIRGFVKRLQSQDSIQDATTEETQGLIGQLSQLMDDQDAHTPQQPSSVPDRSGTTGQFNSLKLAIHFDSGLQLPDLKAKLIVNRLANLSEIISVDPDLEDVDAIEQQRRVTVALFTQRTSEEVRSAADLEGVDSLEFIPVTSHQTAISLPPDGTAEPTPARSVEQPNDATPSEFDAQTLTPVATTNAALPARQVAETVRVDIDRLDQLVNLTGELTVNRERFEQLARSLSAEMKTNGLAGQLLRVAEQIEAVTVGHGGSDDSNGNGAGRQLQQEAARLRACAAQWNNSAAGLAHVVDAVDQLSRISHNLQRSVMETRMVPLAPLFNRFKRVVRDLSSGTDKQVRLSIRGEKTELDKRMIDELSDPLIHLVRNSIDHGLESPAERQRVGKDPVGVITLEAVHRGNNVYIAVGDDGQGVDVDRVRRRAVDRGMTSQETAMSLSHEEVLEFIWSPGFSTAEAVTDISGRGVGMDIVRNRITDLSGTIRVDSTPGVSSTFTIRLPLTLAIIPSFLVRVGDNVFSLPLEEVIEIAAVDTGQIVSVQGRRAVEIRDKYLPLMSLNDAFTWHGGIRAKARDKEAASRTVIVLDIGGKPTALDVDDALGSSDLVIKSLSDNFRPVAGLSGASVLGNGDICLMLDASAVVGLAREQPSHAGQSL